MKKGNAVDIQVKGMSPVKLALIIAKNITGVRIGIYPNHVHIDVLPPNPSKFWLVKNYGQAPIYSGSENNLEKFLRKEKYI